MPPSSQKTALNLLDFLWYFIKNYYYLHKYEEFLYFIFKGFVNDTVLVNST